MAININTDTDEILEDVYLGKEGPFPFRVHKIGGLTNALRRASTMDEDAAGMYLVDSQLKWLEQGFTPEDWAYIEELIEDEESPVDFPHLTQLFKILMEMASNRPTTSSNGSSRQRPARQRKVAPSQSDSALENSDL